MLGKNKKGSLVASISTWNMCMALYKSYNIKTEKQSESNLKAYVCNADAWKYPIKIKIFLPSNVVCFFRESNPTHFFPVSNMFFALWKSMTFTFLLHQIKLETALYVTAAFWHRLVATAVMKKTDTLM